jgi:hypothetical protein
VARLLVDPLYIRPLSLYSVMRIPPQIRPSLQAALQVNGIGVIHSTALVLPPPCRLLFYGPHHLLARFPCLHVL